MSNVSRARMTASLTHLAESIFVAMVNQNPAKLAKRAGLSGLWGASVNPSGGPAFREARLTPYSGRAFDGAARVDAIVALSDKIAVPFELKLGAARLTKSRSRYRVALPSASPRTPTPVGVATLMAILDRRFKGVPDGHDLVARTQESGSNDVKTFVLTREWFVVARRRIIKRWRLTPPAFSHHVKLLAFEDIVDDFGGKPAFNALVTSLLDLDFYDAWLATDDDAG